MLTLKAKKRETLGKKVRKLRKADILPVVLYGPKIKNLNLELNLKEFEKILKQAGESSLIFLELGKEKFSVLIHDTKKDPLTGKLIHVDFYQPILTEEVIVTVPLIFEGQSPAVKELGGTMVKEISEIGVKALPQNLPHEIKVNVGILKTFEDEILIKDLKVPEGVKIQKEPDEIVAVVTPPEKVEEELAEPIAAPVDEPRPAKAGREEKVEEVEKIEEKKEEEGKEIK